MTTAQDPAVVAEHAQQILDEVERAVVGKRDTLELILMAILADGHVLIEDTPGVAKTLIARSFATVTGLNFEFRLGPIFTNILLGDEINRAPPKTQAALLEAMQERQVTSDDRTRALEPPFLVIATQNPIEYEGTYPLPEAQLDRFLVRVAVGYPSPEDEWEMLARRAARATDEVELAPRTTREQLLRIQQAVEQVHVADSLGRYMVELVTASQTHASVQLGASPRGTLALLKLSRARAALAHRDFATPDDVKAVAVAALAHRVLLSPELWVQRVGGADVINDCLRQVPVPSNQPGSPNDPRDA